MTDILIAICLVLAGFILGHIVFPKIEKPTGELVIDTSDPEKDRWLIKLNEPTEKAMMRHVAILEVVHRRITEGDAIWPDEK